MGLVIFDDITIETNEAIIHSRKDGIIQITFKEHTEIDIALQDKLIKIYIELCGDKKKTVFVLRFWWCFNN